MREEKSGEPTPSGSGIAVAMRPDELLLEGNSEIRPCRVCRARLYVATGSLGSIVACPECGCKDRALAVQGPFAVAEFDAAPHHRAEPPIELVALDPSAPASPVLAPVVPYRKLDPRDERSPMVDTVARLQWVGAAFLVAVVVQQLGTFWKRESATSNDELQTYLSAATRLIVAGLMFASSSGVLARTRGGWAVALLTSLAVIGGTLWTFAQRSLEETGPRARFDFGILLELPTFLIAVATAVILIVPRYAWEFRRGRPDQTGTM